VKCHIKSALRNVSTGMGIYDMSKTLSPHHYGDEWANPWKTLLLLRAWSLWRARLHGWVAQKEFRQREQERQAQRFETDLRVACAASGPPLLGSAAAHKLLEHWVPEAAKRCLSPGCSAP